MGSKMGSVLRHLFRLVGRQPVDDGAAACRVVRAEEEVRPASHGTRKSPTRNVFPQEGSQLQQLGPFPRFGLPKARRCAGSSCYLLPPGEGAPKGRMREVATKCWKQTEEIVSPAVFIRSKSENDLYKGALTCYYKHVFHPAPAT